METKVCSKCGIEKELDCFSFRNDTKKYKNICKECINKSHREFRKNNLELMREKDKEYYEKNINKRREQSKKSNAKHIERIKKYKKEYYELNKTRILEKKKEYQEANRDRLKEYLRQYYQDNKDVISEKNKEYAKQHQEEIKEYRKKYLEDNKEAISAQRKDYYQANRESIIEYQNQYRKENPEKLKETRRKTYLKRRENEDYIEKKRKYRLDNLEKEKVYMKEYRLTHKDEINRNIQTKIKNDKIFALKIRVRKTIYDSFARKNFTKNSRAAKILGCDMQTFVDYLLTTYYNNYGYDWDGKEEVHIDHIIPLATANSEKEVYDLCHYTNLQLLRAQDNLEKSDRMDWNLNNE